jgi:copper homeostasis protein
VLTSGGAPTAREGADVLAQLVRRGGDRIAIVAAGGVRAENVAALLARTRVREVHARFEDEAGTRRLVDLL